MESKVDFLACDNPHANKFTIHILAAVAEHEAEQISQRTKDALAAARVLRETPNHSKQTCTSRRAVLAKSKIRDFATGG
jgi:DNA invertase Pin-like site-specific DNA recombinase